MYQKSGSYSLSDFKNEIEILLFKAKTIGIDAVVAQKGTRKDGSSFFAYLSNTEPVATEEILQNAKGYQSASTKTEVDSL